MKITSLIFVALLTLTLMARAEAIAELKLTNGRILHNVEFKSFATESVMAKYAEGAGTIRYELLPPDILAQIESRRPIPQTVEQKIEAVDKIAPKMPSEVTLTSGRILKRVSIIRWEKDRVILKHAAGTEPVAFVLFKNPNKEELAAITEHVWTYKGQAFVVTSGAGSYKLGGMSVYIFPGNKDGQLSSNLDQAKSVKTDADGRFEFTWKGAEPFVISASNHRNAGGEFEYYRWEIERRQIVDPNNVQLSNDNMK